MDRLKDIIKKYGFVVKKYRKTNKIRNFVHS